MKRIQRIRLWTSLVFTLSLGVALAQSTADSFHCFRNFPYNSTGLLFMQDDTIIMAYPEFATRENMGYSFYKKFGEHAATMTKDSVGRSTWYLTRASTVIEHNGEFIICTSGKDFRIVRVDSFGNTVSAVSANTDSMGLGYRITQLSNKNTTPYISHGIKGDTLFISSHYNGDHIAAVYDLSLNEFIPFDFDRILSKFPSVSVLNGMTVVEGKLGFGDFTAGFDNRTPLYYFFDLDADTMVACYLDLADKDTYDKRHFNSNNIVSTKNGTALTSKYHFGHYAPGFAILDTADWSPNIFYADTLNPWIPKYHMSPVGSWYNTFDSTIIVGYRGYGIASDVVFKVLNSNHQITRAFGIGQGVYNLGYPYHKVHKLHDVTVLDNRLLIAGSITDTLGNSILTVLNASSGKIEAHVYCSGVANSLEVNGGYVYASGSFSRTFGGISNHRLIRIDTTDWSIDTNWVFNSFVATSSKPSFAMCDTIAIYSSDLATYIFNPYSGNRVDLNLPFSNARIYEIKKLNNDSLLIASDSGLILSVYSSPKWNSRLIVNGDILTLEVSPKGAYYITGSKERFTTNGKIDEIDWPISQLHYHGWNDSLAPEDTLSFWGLVHDIKLIKDKILIGGIIASSHNSNGNVPVISIASNSVKHQFTPHNSSKKIQFSRPWRGHQKSIESSTFYTELIQKKGTKMVMGFVLHEYNFDSLEHIRHEFIDSRLSEKFEINDEIAFMDIFNDTLYVFSDGPNGNDSVLLFSMNSKQYIGSRNASLFPTSVEFGFLDVSKQGIFLVNGSPYDNFTVSNRAFKASWEPNTTQISTRFSKHVFDFKPKIQLYNLPQIQGDYILNYLFSTNLQYEIQLYNLNTLDKVVIPDTYKTSDYFKRFGLFDSTLFLLVYNDESKKISFIEYSLDNPSQKPKSTNNRIIDFLIEDSIQYTLETKYVKELSAYKNFLNSTHLPSELEHWESEIKNLSGSYKKINMWVNGDFIVIYADTTVIIDKVTGQIVKSITLPWEVYKSNHVWHNFFKLYFKEEESGQLCCFDLLSEQMDFANPCYKISGDITQLAFDSNYVYCQTKHEFEFDKKLYEYRNVMLSRWYSDDQTEPTMIDLSPSGVGRGPVSFHITGFALNAIDSILVIGSNDDTLKVSRNALASSSTSKLNIDLDLTEFEIGKYHIVGELRGGDSYTNGLVFSIDSTRPPMVKVELVFPQYTRPGEPESGQVILTNMGNLDAFDVPVYLATSKEFQSIQTLPQLRGVSGSITKSSQVGALNNFEPFDSVRSWIIPRIPANSEVYLNLHFVLSTEFGKENKGYYHVQLGELWGSQASLPEFDSTWERYNTLLECYFDTKTDSQCIDSTFKSTITAKYHTPSELTLKEQSVLRNNPTYLFDQVALLKNTIFQCYDSTKDFAPAFNIVSQHLLGALIPRGQRCDTNNWTTYDLTNSATGVLKVVSSHDPNNKVGFRGKKGYPFTNKQHNTHVFTINFENDSAASAPAQIVRIIDTLDKNVFDLESVKFISFSVGQTLKTFGKTTKKLNHTFDMVDEASVYLSIRSSLDTVAGELLIEFVSLDPITGEQEALDKLHGFLPPNRTGSDGKGSISFLINLKQDIGLVPRLSNSANIIFDQNDPIPTNTWHIIHDTFTPKSNLELVDYDNNTFVKLSWDGFDSISGIDNYKIYKSLDNHNYVQEHASISAGTAVFNLEPNNINYFKAISSDSAGNTELKNRYDFVIDKTIDSSKSFKSTIAITCKNNSKAKEYYGPKSGPNVYSLSTQITNTDSDTLGIKTITFDVKLSQDYSYRHWSFDTLKIGSTVINLLGAGLYELNKDTLQVEIDQVTPQHKVLSIKLLNSGHRRKQGFIKLAINKSEDVKVVTSIDGFNSAIHNSTSVLSLSLLINNYTQKASHATQVDRYPPTLTYLPHSKYWSNPMYVSWVSFDSNSGLNNTTVKLYDNSGLIKTHISDSEKDSIQISSFQNTTYRIRGVACDNVLNCSPTVSELLDHNVGVNAIRNGNIKVFPTISDGRLYVSGLNQTQVEMHITNSLGQKVKSFANPRNGYYQIDLPKGLYYLTFESSSSITSIPIILL